MNVLEFLCLQQLAPKKNEYVPKVVLMHGLDADVFVPASTGAESVKLSQLCAAAWPYGRSAVSYKESLERNLKDRQERLEKSQKIVDRLASDVATIKEALVEAEKMVASLPPEEPEKAAEESKEVLNICNPCAEKLNGKWKHPLEHFVPHKKGMCDVCLKIQPITWDVSNWELGNVVKASAECRPK